MGTGCPLKISKVINFDSVILPLKFLMGLGVVPHDSNPIIGEGQAEGAL